MLEAGRAGCVPPWAVLSHSVPALLPGPWLLALGPMPGVMAPASPHPLHLPLALGPVPGGTVAPASPHPLHPPSCTRSSFVLNRERAVDFLNLQSRLYVFDGFAGWDAEVRRAGWEPNKRRAGAQGGSLRPGGARGLGGEGMQDGSIRGPEGQGGPGRQEGSRVGAGGQPLGWAESRC